MSTDPNDLSIEELEKLLAEKRAQQRFATRLATTPNLLEQSVEKITKAGAHHPRVGPESGSPLRRLANHVLLGVEVLVVLGLVLAGAGIYVRLQELNRDAAQVQSQALSQKPEAADPAAAATLPGSSQPPSAVTPERFKGMIEQVVPVAIPTPGPQQPVRIVIPSLKVDALVVEGDDWEALKKGAGHHIGSADPGQRGNLIISGHDDVFGEIFRNIGDLKPGDEVDVYSKEAQFIYIVKNKRIVEPTEVSVMQQTTEPALTLITCYPYLVDTQRTVVTAQLAQ